MKKEPVSASTLIMPLIRAVPTNALLKEANAPAKLNRGA